VNLRGGDTSGGRGGSGPSRTVAGYLSALEGEEIQERRNRLRRLDDCLNLLEQAHERDMTEVSDRMAEMLQARVPSLCVGMLISDAIEEVLRQQEPYMVQMRPEHTERRLRRRREPFDIRLLLARRY
jgi:hypothetical protein